MQSASKVEVISERIFKLQAPRSNTTIQQVPKGKVQASKKVPFYQLQSAKAQHHASHVVLACGNGLSMVDTVLALKELNCPKPIYSLSTHGFKIFIAQQKPTRRISNYTPCNELKSFVSLLALKRL